MDRTWVQEVGDLGAALPAVVQLDRVTPENHVELSVYAMGEEQGARCYLVVIGSSLTASEAAIIGGIVSRIGSPTTRTVAELMANPGPSIRASGPATSIVVAVNEWLRRKSTS